MPGVTSMQVRAHVGEQVDLQAEDRAVARRRPARSRWIWSRPWCMAALPSLRDSVHLTGRPSRVATSRREDLLAVDLQLGAEPAADVGRDHPQLVLGDAGGRGQHHPQDVRDLGGRPHGDSPPSPGAATDARGSIAVGISRCLT